MGNCQAAETVTVMIQHQDGKVERLYWPTTADEVMKSNPGHHVALVTLSVAELKKDNNGNGNGNGNGTVRFTRVRLLKPKDILLIGQVYRLVTSQEVNKALGARKHEKTMRAQSELLRKHSRQQSTSAGHQISTEAKVDQVAGQDRHRPKNAWRQWRPSLQSISEGMS